MDNNQDFSKPPPGWPRPQPLQNNCYFIQQRENCVQGFMPMGPRMPGNPQQEAGGGPMSMSSFTATQQQMAMPMAMPMPMPMPMPAASWTPFNAMGFLPWWGAHNHPMFNASQPVAPMAVPGVGAASTISSTAVPVVAAPTASASSSTAVAPGTSSMADAPTKNTTSLKPHRHSGSDSSEDEMDIKHSKQLLAIKWKDESDLSSDFEEVVPPSKKAKGKKGKVQQPQQSKRKVTTRTRKMATRHDDDEDEPKAQPDFSAEVIIISSDSEDSKTSQNGDAESEDEVCCIGLETVGPLTEMLWCKPCGCTKACVQHAVMWMSQKDTCYYCRTLFVDGEVVLQCLA